MFEIFDKRSPELTEPGFDLQELLERLAEILVESGLDPDSRTYYAVHKMLADDLIWYFEQVADERSLEM